MKKLLSKIFSTLLCASLIIYIFSYGLLCQKDGIILDMDALISSGLQPGEYLDEQLMLRTGIWNNPNNGFKTEIYDMNAFNTWIAAGGDPKASGFPDYIWKAASGKYSSTPSAPATPKCSHEYTVKQTKAPNCTEEGENTYTCTKCGNTYTEPIPTNGAHNYSSEETTKPTCTESGEVTYTCIICGDTYTEPVEATGHDYSSEQTKAPTCTEEGEITYTCKNCGDTYTEPIEALGHTPSDWTITKPASLWVHGETIKTCTVCGEVLETKVIESTLPIWTLYAGIGVVVVLIVVAILLIMRYRRLHK